MPSPLATRPITARRYYENNTDKVIYRLKRWRSENPDKFAAQRRRRKLRGADKNALRKRRDREATRPRPDRCENTGCQRIGPVFFDHCHDTGKFRGWLCHHCNTVLGMAGDSVDRLRGAIQYLEAFQCPAPR